MLLKPKDIAQTAIDSGHLPEYLYRYRPFNEKTLDEISKGYIWYSCLYDYNDPFEGAVRFDTDCTDAELKHYVENKSITGLFAPDKTEYLLKHFLANPNKLNQYVENAKNNVFKTIGICSFSVCPDNILMWSHYASSHTGICIKYKTKNLVEGGIFPLKIDYTDKYPKFNYITENDDLLKLAIESFSKKSKAWGYEQEFRLMNNNSRGKRGLKRHTIEEIIFGCKCDEDKTDQILSVLTNNIYQRPLLKKAIQQTDKYELRIENSR